MSIYAKEHFVARLRFYLGACGANQLGFELALEKINYKGVVPHLVPLPCLLCHHLHQYTKHMAKH